jgi:hypothetical protein
MVRLYASTPVLLQMRIIFNSASVLWYACTLVLLHASTIVLQYVCTTSLASTSVLQYVSTTRAINTPVLQYACTTLRNATESCRLLAGITMSLWVGASVADCDNPAPMVPAVLLGQAFASDWLALPMVRASMMTL